MKNPTAPPNTRATRVAIIVTTIILLYINDLLILPGADTWFEQDNQKIIKVAKDRIEKGLKIAAICGATGALAKAGALNNKKHTSNDIEYLKMFSPEYTGEAYYVNEPVIKDENLITASGLAPIEFTYEIIKQLDLFSEETLSAWYNLYIKKEQKYNKRRMG